LIQNNIFYTSASQLAPIRVDSDVSDNIIIKDNLLRGENTDILLQGENKTSIIVKGNIPSK
jgi:hypothetical protein